MIDLKSDWLTAFTWNGYFYYLTMTDLEILHFMLLLINAPSSKGALTYSYMDLYSQYMASLLKVAKI